MSIKIIPSPLSSLPGGHARDPGGIKSPIGSGAQQQFSEEHLAAVNRRRRCIFMFDAIHGDPNFAKTAPEDLVELSFKFFDEEGSHIDCISWNWCTGNQAPYPSKILPLYDDPDYRKWIADGIDIMQVFLEATHKRGLEAFHSYWINAGDGDLPVRWKIPLKEAHPDWLLPIPWDKEKKILWNFAIPEVRKYKLRVLREVAENYDFDGIEINFSSSVHNFPSGQQWKHRDTMTEFMRKVRSMTMEVAAKRGRPLLLATRVPENLEGCHMDGLDLESWAREVLVDIIVMGDRSYDVDVAAFRRITAGTHTKLYAGSDEHHTSDGYDWPPIEVLRGVISNWWRQGIDGVYMHNWTYALGGDAARIGVLLHDAEAAPMHRQLLHEIGEAKALYHKDKTFVLQRRGGGGSGAPPPTNWITPRFYFHSNMFAPLPTPLDNTGKADTLLMLFVSDDLGAEAGHIKDVTFRMILHDAGGGEYVDFSPVPRHHHGPDGEITYDSRPDDPPLPIEGRIERGLISLFKNVSHLYNTPPEKGIEKRLGVRINNVPLAEPSIEDGWLVFKNVKPNLFAVGNNVVGIVVKGRDPHGPQMTVEKLELHVKYRKPS